MCIIAFQYKTNPQYNLIIAANRDEFYERPTKPAYLWDTTPRIYAGQDVLQGGTWMGVSETGRFAAITNYRNPALDVLKPVSRGKIATDFLLTNESASDFANSLRSIKDEFGPCNVLLFDGSDFFHYNNVFDEITEIAPGTHTLCNATLNTPWPKTEKLGTDVASVLTKEQWENNQLLTALQNQELADDHLLPSTGVPYDMEKALSAIFIKLPHYGTRASTIINMQSSGADYFEQTYVDGQPTNAVEQYISFK